MVDAAAGMRMGAPRRAADGVPRGRHKVLGPKREEVLAHDRLLDDCTLTRVLERRTHNLRRLALVIGIPTQRARIAVVNATREQ